MLKVLAAVLAVLSAIISITLYSTTIPAIQKQSEDNAAAIDQIQSGGESGSGSVTLYKHELELTANTGTAKLTVVSTFPSSITGSSGDDGGNVQSLMDNIISVNNVTLNTDGAYYYIVASGGVAFIINIPGSSGGPFVVMNSSGKIGCTIIDTVSTYQTF